MTEKNSTMIGHAAFNAGVTCRLAVNVSDRTSMAGIALKAHQHRLSAEQTVQFHGGLLSKTTGTADTTLYAPQTLVGSRPGRPNTAGALGEINYNAWAERARGIAYVAYSKFNGASTAYDVAGGRNASDNNTLYVYLFLAF